LNKVLESIST